MPDQTTKPPPAILTRGAQLLEQRLPRTVTATRGLRDRTLRWRDSYAYRRYPDPGKPYGARYWRNHRQAVTEALSDPRLVALFDSGQPLPPGYGKGLDERLVEFPWTMAHAPFGRTLDAGSALNHPHVLDHVTPLVDDLSVVTLAPESASFPERGISYLYADLRRLPFCDDWFDTVISISTLEHVGMDNRRWGTAAVTEPDPEGELREAALELKRVVRPGGRILITLPYGEPEDHGWLRQLDRDEVEALADALGGSSDDIDVYQYGREGWRAGDLESAAGARYQRDNAPAVDPAAEDLAPAARAVACLAVRV